MRNVLVVLAVIVAVGFASSYRLETPVYCGGTDDVLSYDDGTSHWLTWGGLYRGVWFDVTDFDPSGTGFECDYTEYWFFHHSSYPWDTASFYAELWNGTSASPTALLDQTSMMATHNTAILCNYSPAIIAEGEFWALVNTSMSAGGWPAILGDNTPNTVSHSFFSDDFIIWEPWIIQGPMANDYLARASGTILSALESESWGAIKGLYR